MNKCLEHIKINPAGELLSGMHRQGTVWCKHSALEGLLGVSHGSWGSKIASRWFLETPRGRVAVHDFWSNSVDEFIVTATNRKAARWVAAYLRKFLRNHEITVTIYKHKIGEPK